MSNATLVKIINRNEKEANIMTGKVMAITFVIFTFVYILNLLGIFIVDQTAMTSAYFLSIILLFSPLIINEYCDPAAKWIKYLYVLLSGLFLFVLTTTLTYHVVLVYAYPIAIAGMYSFADRYAAFTLAGALMTISRTFAILCCSAYCQGFCCS